jgi:intracellular sulfur oxidation DsrE/DsrF family protein
MPSNKVRVRAHSWRRTGLALVLGLMMTGNANAQDANHPVIAGYGAIHPAQDLANLPDPSLRYRVAFEITRAANDTGQVNPALDRVARFINLLGAAGVRPDPGDIVVVMHGPATPSILRDAAYETRFHQANPNSGLIAKLQQAGVAIHVCSFALANQRIERDEVAKGVTIDLAAMVTLANLQLKGWALIL